MKKVLFFICIQLLSTFIFAQTAITLCPYITSFSSMTRGYYFTAPVSFTICGVFVPTDVSTGPQSIEIVRFTAGPPPAYSAITNNFVSLFYVANSTATTMIPCNVSVTAGDIIGVYGSRGAAVNSYGQTQCPTTILGNAVTLYRSGMQADLGLGQMQNIWSEISYNIGRVQIYINCCPTSTFTVTTPICIGASSTITYTGSGTSGDTYNWNFDGGTAVPGTGIGPHTVTWSTSGVHNITLSVSDATCTSSVTTVPVTVNTNPTIIINPSSPYICSGGSTNLTASGASSYIWSPSTGLSSTSGAIVTANPTSNTTYSVIGTDVNGCTNSSTITVSIFPSPNITASNNTPICSGDTIKLIGIIA